MCLRFSWLLLALCWSSVCTAEAQKFAILGTLELTSGDVIDDCRVGFRTYGTLKPNRDNILIMPTWHTGTTSNLEEYELIGPKKLLDTTNFFIVTIDALGNGVSTSPSNSKKQPGSDFPQVSIADMVYSQYRLLTEVLNIQSVHAVVGISMGGMQTFQWIRQYPQFMTKAVAIDGSPYLTSYDVIQWQTHLNVIRSMQESGRRDEEIVAVLSPLTLLTLWTPDYFVEIVPRKNLQAYLEQTAGGFDAFDGDNYIVQTQAMIDHNAFDSGTEQYESNLRNIATELLVVSVPGDHMVNPATAKSLAASIDAEMIEISSNCGHMGTTCENAEVAQQVNVFLQSK